MRNLKNPITLEQYEFAKKRLAKYEVLKETGAEISEYHQYDIDYCLDTILSFELQEEGKNFPENPLDLL